MGPASLSLARSFKQYHNNLNYSDILTLDKHLIGSSRTRSSNSLITDSAAGATAFSCGEKSYNGAIGIDDQFKPCGTILEALKLKGYLTGLVVTTRITDATPASFSSHVKYRSFEDLIALHQLGHYPLGRVVDLLIGGGRTHFYSNESSIEYGSKGSRLDGRNLIEEALNEGWNYIGNRTSFDNAEIGQLPILGLLDDFDIPFEIDRNDSIHPSLKEQTKFALESLNKASENSNQGFFLLVEGSRIDHAGHYNDPATQVREVLSFDETFQEILKFAENSSVETLIISTSDHETGGLAVGRQISAKYPDYKWFPEILNNVKHSGEYLTSKILNYNGDDLENFLKDEIILKGLGINDLKDEEFSKLLQNIESPHYILNELISIRSQTGWSTHGHSAVDVNIYGYSNKKDVFTQILTKLNGNRENIEIGKFLQDYTNVDIDEITSKLVNTTIEPRN
ncbi:hypothetical protein WICMUC_005717 [Wickerhamomyces mucosus]|uniref:Alkaline phosphatase n=1 Tax=Wickerhamomyces mucosus TaxID=1378264 RepID=A0A9P8P3T2_9ASCO|nr:hypothetical protein WICMUC_005717 [Wickerhamomyces mucosus]